MKICYLGFTILPWTRNVANYFAEKGDDVYFITFERPETGYKNVRIIQIKTRSGLFKYLLYVPKIREIISKIKPDIIHVNWAASYGLTSYFVDFHPLVISCIGGDVPLGEQKFVRNPMLTLLLKLLIKKILKKADYLLPISKEIEKKLISFGFRKDMMQTFFIGPIIEDIVGEKDEAMIFSNRQLKRFYQVDAFLKAAALVKKEFPNIKIVVAGEGDKKQEYIRLAHKLGLRDNVEFTGRLPQKEMFGRVSQACIFISTSPSDGTPESILEAMELNTPVVAVDNQANKEWIKHNFNGYLFSAGDYRKAADYILDLLKDKDKRRLFSERSYKIVKEKADFNKNIAKLEKLYNSLVKTKPHN